MKTPSIPPLRAIEYDNVVNALNKIGLGNIKFKQFHIERYRNIIHRKLIMLGIIDIKDIPSEGKLLQILEKYGKQIINNIDDSTNESIDNIINPNRYLDPLLKQISDNNLKDEIKSNQIDVMILKSEIKEDERLIMILGIKGIFERIKDNNCMKALITLVNNVKDLNKIKVFLNNLSRDNTKIDYTKLDLVIAELNS